MTSKYNYRLTVQHWGMHSIAHRLVIWGGNINFTFLLYCILLASMQILYYHCIKIKLKYNLFHASKNINFKLRRTIAFTFTMQTFEMSFPSKNDNIYDTNISYNIYIHFHILWINVLPRWNLFVTILIWHLKLLADLQIPTQFYSNVMKSLQTPAEICVL